MRKQVGFAADGSEARTTALTTPPSENRRSSRLKHVPTPKMSGRKKALFELNGRSTELLSEDSDLGPITPLRFGNVARKALNKGANITSFRNILGDASPESDRSISPDFEKRFSYSDRYEILSVTCDKENHMSDEDTRLSFPNGTPRIRTISENALIDETNSNSLSLLMNTDLNLVDKKTKALKTPGITEAMDQRNETKKSFRKMTHVNNSITPSNDDYTPPVDSSHESKARTSLSFSEIQPISTKSFYSSTPNVRTIPKRSPVPVQSASFSSKGKKASSGHRKNRTNKKREKPIRLGNRGVFHKIKKPVKPKSAAKKLSTSHILDASSALALDKSRTEESQQKSASTPTTPKDPLLLQQINRVRKILQESSKNPIEYARPLSFSKSLTDLTHNSSYTDEDECSENEENVFMESDGDDHGNSDGDDAKSEGGGRKFFKSSNSRRIKREYKVINNVSATVRKGGKLTLNPNKQKKRKYRSMFEDEFDFETEQLEVDGIISKLTNTQDVYPEAKPAPQVPLHIDEQTKPADVAIVDVQSQGSDDDPIPLQDNVIFVDRCSIVQGIEPDSSTQLLSETTASQPAVMEPAEPTHADPQTIPSNEQKLYPIFYKEHQRNLTETNDISEPYYGLFDPEPRRQQKHQQKWRPIGSDQYQIDAGQKQYGAHTCPECGLVYSVHEPEEELIHQNYHNSLHTLKFPGWSNETVVAQVPEWDVSGRILAVTMLENAHKLQKVQDILSVVDRELGYTDECQLVPGSIVYLAVARSMVLGVCAAQPLQCANRLLAIDGIDSSLNCCTLETYPTKCGISRIWVSPNFRGHGIARTILTVLKSHFIFGHPMGFDEIAFSTPTEAGKRMAERITGRKDFLIYM